MEIEMLRGVYIVRSEELVQNEGERESYMAASGVDSGLGASNPRLPDEFQHLLETVFGTRHDRFTPPAGFFVGCRVPLAVARRFARFVFLISSRRPRLTLPTRQSRVAVLSLHGLYGKKT